MHVRDAKRIARICREAGVRKLIHVSALNANVDSKSEYLKTKALGEIAVREEFPEAIVVRPARIAGHEDWLFRQMGFFAKHGLFSYVPVIDGGKATMRPVYVYHS